MVTDKATNAMNKCKYKKQVEARFAARRSSAKAYVAKLGKCVLLLRNSESLSDT
jgi:hypothetical protein